jgi:hypothetical protein
VRKAESQNRELVKSEHEQIRRRGTVIKEENDLLEK